MMLSVPISESLIQQHSTSDSFVRGEAYVREGAVEALIRRGDTIQASVRGSEPDPYQVTVTVAGSGDIQARCTCLYASRGWCKHIVASLLSVVREPQRIEERASLAQLLAPLERDALRALLVGLVENDPALIEVVEAQIPLVTAPAGATVSGAPAPPVPIVTAAAARHALHGLFGGSRRRRDYGGYEGIGSIVTGVDQQVEKVLRMIRAGAGRDALLALEAITDEIVSHLDEWYDMEGEEYELFAGIGAAWTEALLSLDLPPEERQEWREQLETVAHELAEYGYEDAFDAALTAAKQGWDYPPLVRVLKGEAIEADRRPAGYDLEDSDDDAPWQSLWRGADTPWQPHWLDNEMLTRARLNVLERVGRMDEYLRLADAAGEVVASASMLARLRRVPEAVTYARQHLTRADDALAIAQALQGQGEAAEALAIAEYGFDLKGSKAALAAWAAELAAARGERERALAAAELAVREAPTLASYLRARELAGEAWPKRRALLLAHLRALPANAAYLPGPVEIFLHERLIADAIATVDRTTAHTLLAQVADAALTTHPDWVIATSRREAEAIMDQGKSGSYDVAARWVARARDAYRAAGREVHWREYHAALLTKHARKYKLIPLLKPLAR